MFFIRKSNQTTDKYIIKKKNRNKEIRESIYEPWGIHVARTESLLFRLLKAVLIPTTIRNLLFPDESVFESPDEGEPLRIDSCVALAAANSISKFEIVLSNVLIQHTTNNFQLVTREIKITKIKSLYVSITYCIALWVLKTSPKMSLVSRFTSFWCN